MAPISGWQIGDDDGVATRRYQGQQVGWKRCAAGFAELEIAEMMWIARFYETHFARLGTTLSYLLMQD